MDTAIRIQKQECPHCGSPDVKIPPYSDQGKCASCGQTFHVARQVPVDREKAPQAVPFAVSRNGFTKKFLQWLIDGDYTPDDIIQTFDFTGIKPTLCPFYRVSGTYKGQFHASVGYDDEQEYQVRDSEGNVHTRTKTVTKWQPHGGALVGQYAFDVFANEDLSEDVSKFVLETTVTDEGATDIGDVVGNEDVDILEHKMTERQAWEKFGQETVNRMGGEEVKANLPGDKIKDLTSKVFAETKEFRKLFLPFWIGQYKYGDNEYRFLMDGCNGSRMAGAKPEDEKRKVAVHDAGKESRERGIHLAIYMAVASLIALLIGANIQSDGGRTFVGFLWFAGTLAFGIRYGIAASAASDAKQEILSKSRAIREAALNGFFAEHPEVASASD